MPFTAVNGAQGCFRLPASEFRASFTSRQGVRILQWGEAFLASQTPRLVLVMRDDQHPPSVAQTPWNQADSGEREEGRKDLTADLDPEVFVVAVVNPPSEENNERSAPEYDQKTIDAYNRLW